MLMKVKQIASLEWLYKTHSSLRETMKGEILGLYLPLKRAMLTISFKILKQFSAQSMEILQLKILKMIKLNLMVSLN